MEEIKKLLEYRDKLQEKITDIIGYKSFDDSPIDLDENVFWIMKDDEFTSFRKR